MDYEGILLNFGLNEASTFNEFLASMRSYRLNSKNYANMFLTKAKVMVTVLHSAFDNLERCINTAHLFYELQVNKF